VLDAGELDLYECEWVGGEYYEDSRVTTATSTTPPIHQTLTCLNSHHPRKIQASSDEPLSFLRRRPSKQRKRAKIAVINTDQVNPKDSHRVKHSR